MEWMIFVPLLALYFLSPIIALGLVLRTNARVRELEATIRRLSDRMQDGSRAESVREAQDPRSASRTAPGIDRLPLAEARPGSTDQPVDAPQRSAVPPFVVTEFADAADEASDVQAEAEFDVAEAEGDLAQHPDAALTPLLDSQRQRRVRHETPAAASLDSAESPSTAQAARSAAAAGAPPPSFNAYYEARLKSAAPAPPRSPMLSERLGANIAVWLGSLALFLSGAFLVKYSFDAGLLTPLTRVAIGIAFGLVLLVAGEYLRTRSANVAQGLTAAGVADLFACLLAATNLYHMIGRPTGFALLAATTAAAVVLSLRQGPFVALLGLIGGFATPALIGSNEPQPAPLFAYLLLLQTGLMFVARRRRWWSLAALTQAGALGWTAVWLAANYKPEHSIWIAPFLLASAVLFVLATDMAGVGEPAGTAAWTRPLAVVGAGASLLMLCALVGASGYSGLDWAFLGLLSAASVLLGRLRPRYEPLAWLAAAAALGLLNVWHVQYTLKRGALLPPKPAGEFDAIMFGRAVLGLGAIFAAGGFAALWRAANAARWAALSVVAAICYLLTAYWALPAPLLGLRWSLWCLALAAVYSAGTALVWKRRETVGELNFVLAALVAGATSFVSLAAPIELQRAWIAVAWAIEVPVLAVIATRLRVRQIAHMGALLTVLTGVWMLRPGTLDYPLGDDAVFNWILYGYGIPLAAFALSAWLLWRRPAAEALEWHAGLSESAAVIFALVLFTIEIRHFFHADALRSAAFCTPEIATYCCAWLYLPLPMLWLARHHERGVLRPAARAVAGLGMFAALAGLCLFYCPLFRSESVGGMRVLNHLLYWYGGPAVLAAMLAAAMQRCRLRSEALFAAGLAVVMLFMLVTLEVRQAFQGAYLNRGGAEGAEWYAYSAAWVVLGLLLMLAGVATRGLVLRWSSLLVMLLAVGKVFLSDTAHLKDLYRVFSLFGLGVSLLLLAFLYQRFVFGGGRRKEDAEQSLA